MALLSLLLPSGLAVGDTVTHFGFRAQSKAIAPLLKETLLVKSNLLAVGCIQEVDGRKMGHLELLHHCDSYMYVKEQSS